jgi:hypothetical protein
MGSDARERRTEPAPSTPRPNAGKRRCLVLLRVTKKGVIPEPPLYPYLAVYTVTVVAALVLAEPVHGEFQFC